MMSRDGGGGRGRGRSYVGMARGGEERTINAGTAPGERVCIYFISSA
jgi:hypothetical protein